MPVSVSIAYGQNSSKSLCGEINNKGPSVLGQYAVNIVVLKFFSFCHKEDFIIFFRRSPPWSKSAQPCKKLGTPGHSVVLIVKMWSASFNIRGSPDETMFNLVKHMVHMEKDMEK